MLKRRARFGRHAEGDEDQGECDLRRAVRALGGTPVNLSPAECVLRDAEGRHRREQFPVFVSADYKLYEVAKAMTRPTFGRGTRDADQRAEAQSLSAESRNIVLDEGRKIVPIDAMRR